MTRTALVTGASGGIGGATARDLGVAIATGHTGRYEGCSFPTVGGATEASIWSIIFPIEAVEPGYRDRDAKLAELG